MRLIVRWNRAHPAVRATYLLADRRSWHLRLGRLFLAFVIR